MGKYKRALLTSFALSMACLAHSSRADSFSGNDLYAFLQQDNTASMSTGQYYHSMKSANEGGIGRGYVAGAIDAANGLQFCIPPDVLLPQSIEIVFNHLKQFPELRRQTAKTNVVNALAAKFPCPPRN